MLRAYENPTGGEPARLAARADRLYAKWHRANKKATNAEGAGASRREQDKFDLAAAEAYTEFEDARTELAELIDSCWDTGDLRSNPLFGLFGGKGKQRRGAKEYYATALNKHDEGGDVHPAKKFRAPNKTEARKQAVDWLRDAGYSPRDFKIELEEV